MKTLLLAVLSLVAAQSQPPPRPAPPPEAAYVVGVGDELQLRVFGEDDMSRDRLLVDADGTIEVPQLGRMKAAGRTARDIQEHIAEELVRRKIFVRQPSVSVSVAVFRSQAIRVEGRVNRPGEIVMKGRVVTLPDAIYEAGYFAQDAGPFVYVFRARPGESPAAMMSRKPDLEVAREDINAGRAAGVRLQDGDKVVVPAAPTFKVTGHVRSPAIYTWRPNLTVWEAISALAGGLTERGTKGRVQIQRLVDGKRVTFGVKKVEEELVQPDDTIIVRPRII
jgi:polysaccharide export outer membrane protein